jgi:hypothetical protein
VNESKNIEEMTEEERNIAYKIFNNAYEMFPSQLHEAGKDSVKPFEMYSYERVSDVFWSAFIKQLIACGLNEEETVYLLQSKKMRHMLDGQDWEIEDLAINMAKLQCNQEVKEID